MFSRFKFIIIIIVSSIIISGLNAGENRFIIEQRNRSIINLSVKAARIVNETAEPQARVETLDGSYSIGRWTEPGDRVEWLFNITKPGKYYILIETACLKSRAGGIAEFKVGSESREFQVVATEGWKDFTFTRLGDSFRLNGGEHRLEVLPVQFDKTLMNLRAVLLVPANIAPERVIAERERANTVRARAYTFYRKGWELEKEKRYSAALTQYKEALKVDKSYGEAYYRTAITLLNKLKKPEEALRYFKEGSPYVHYNHWFYTNYAVTLGRLKHHAEGIEQYNRAAQLYLNNGQAVPYWVYLNPGVSYYHYIKDYDSALTYFVRVYENGNYAPEERDKALYYMVLTYRALGKSVLARQTAELYLKDGLNSEYKGRFYLEQAKWYLNAGEKPEKGREYLALSVKESTQAIAERDESKCYAIYYLRGEAYELLGDIEKGYHDRLKAYEIRPDLKAYRIVAADRAYWLGCLRLVEYRYDEAIRLFRKGLSLKPDEPDYYQRYLHIATEHRKYRDVKPDYTYRMAEIITRQTDAAFTESDGRVLSYKGEIEEEQLTRRLFTQKLFIIAVEALTKGQLTVELDSYESNSVITKVGLGVRPDGSRYFYPDPRVLEFKLAPYLLENRNYYDGYIYYWRAGNFLTVATGGGEAPNYIPYTLNGPVRGRITIPAEWTTWRWAFGYLHEFWHSLENIVPMKPMHGWKPENIAEARRNFPGWKGSDEWSWYLYHSSKTIPAFLKEKSSESGLSGYSNINFILRYPDSRGDEELKALLERARKMPLEELRKGWEMQEQGHPLWSKGDKAGAIAFYLKALEHNPYLVEAMNRLAGHHLGNKEYAEAITYYNSLLALLPGDPTFNWKRGDCNNGLERYEEARIDYTKSLEQKADNPWAYVGRAKANFTLENYEAAIADYSRAIELEPGRGWMYKNRGYYYYKLAGIRESKELYNKAKADYLQALKIDPADSTAIKMLESIKKRLGG